MLGSDRASILCLKFPGEELLFQCILHVGHMKPQLLLNEPLELSFTLSLDVIRLHGKKEPAEGKNHIKTQRKENHSDMPKKCHFH